MGIGHWEFLFRMYSAAGLGKYTESLWHWYKWQGQNVRSSAYLFAIKPNTRKLWMAQKLHQVSFSTCLPVLHPSAEPSPSQQFQINPSGNSSRFSVVSQGPWHCSSQSSHVLLSAFSSRSPIWFMMVSWRLAADLWKYIAIGGDHCMYLHAKYSLLSSCMKHRTPRCNFCILQIELEISSS